MLEERDDALRIQAREEGVEDGISGRFNAAEVVDELADEGEGCGEGGVEGGGFEVAAVNDVVPRVLFPGVGC